VENERERVQVRGHEEAQAPQAGVTRGAKCGDPNWLVTNFARQPGPVLSPSSERSQRREREHALLRHERLDGGVAGQVGEVHGRERARGDGGRQRREERALCGGREGDERRRGAVPRREALGQLRE
jgi:hypothetical protein